MTYVDWRKPIQAQAEETYWTDYSEDGEQPRRSIRWLLSTEGYGRVHRGEACWNCLSGFPAPLGRGHLDDWHMSEFKFIVPWAQARKLIRNDQCPLCRAECTSEMLTLQTDDAFQKEDDTLSRNAQLNLEDEIEREDHVEAKVIDQLGLVDPVAPPSKERSMKKSGES